MKTLVAIWGANYQFWKLSQLTVYAPRRVGGVMDGIKDIRMDFQALGHVN